ncbi:LamG domain-containing protein [Candidatus Woesearchaeota archaeon]|nr:LamG domain-containing protein [Candidatus Woesearchaeota archaeon]
MREMSPKGQSSIEHAMAYGFAAVFVLVTISAIAYFGILDFSSAIPEWCTAPEGKCSAYRIDAGTGKINLTITGNSRLYITSVTLKSSSGNILCRFSTDTPLLTEPKQAAHIQTSPCTGIDGTPLGDTGRLLKKNRYDVTMQFSNKAGGIIHEGKGGLFGKGHGKPANISFIDTETATAYWALERDATDRTMRNNGFTTAACTSPGNKGRACSFSDGSHITVPDTEFLNPGPKSFTIIAWLRRANTATTPSAIISKGTPTQPGKNLAYTLFVDAGNGLSFRASDTGTGFSTVSTSPDAITDTEWHQAAAVYTYKNVGSGNAISLYLDGRLAGAINNAQGPIAHSPEPLIIGGAGPTGEIWPFNGIIDEVRIINASLTEEDLQAIYNSERS